MGGFLSVFFHLASEKDRDRTKAGWLIYLAAARFIVGVVSMKEKTDVLAYLALFALVAAFAMLVFTQQASAGAGTPDAMTSAANSVLVYSNGMAFVSSVAKGDVSSAGKARLRIENFTDSAVLGTIRAQDSGGEIYWAKKYYEEKTTSEKQERYLTIDELLNQSYGKQVRASTDQGEVAGKLLWVYGGKVGIESNGRLTVVSDPKRIEADFGETKKTDEKNATSYEHGLELYMNAAKPGPHSVLLSYITGGANWKASYNFETSGAIRGTGKLEALSEVENNAGEDWKNATLRVAVGSPYFIENSYYYPSAYPSYRDAAYAPQAMEAKASGGSAPSFAGGDVGTQYIYTLSEPVTILKGERAALKLFEAQSEYERDNVWESGGAVQQVMRVKNKAGKPFASGVLRVYESGVFMGEGNIEYTGEGREAEAAFAALPQLAVKKESNQTGSQNFGKSVETTYTVALTVESSSKEKAPLTLRDYMAYGDRVELLSSSVPVKRMSNNKLEWKIDVPANENVTIAYVYKVTAFNRYY